MAYLVDDLRRQFRHFVLSGKPSRFVLLAILIRPLLRGVLADEDTRKVKGTGQRVAVVQALAYGVANIWRFLHAVSVPDVPRWGKLTAVSVCGLALGLAALFGTWVKPLYASLIKRLFYVVK
ncbi:hypothetical protein DL151_09355 [Salmonella enterica subsp. salamae]|nr:hypothetical protein [Salmonella enterica subsp. salamae]MJG38934.1 hypothetical protein [Salmonella enterica subsp. salamae]